MAESLPNQECTAVTSVEGCGKDKKKRDRFYSHTAGILVLVRPCGIIINWTKMFACESMAQVFFFLINTFGRGQDSSAVRCDRTCCLHPYLKNLKKKAPFAKYILKNMKFLINSSMWLNMLVQPGLPKFSELKGCNTQCAEQSFAWINKIRR